MKWSDACVGLLLVLAGVAQGTTPAHPPSWRATEEYEWSSTAGSSDNLLPALAVGLTKSKGAGDNEPLAVPLPQCPGSPDTGRLLLALRLLDESGLALEIVEHAQQAQAKGQPTNQVLDGMMEEVGRALLPLYPELRGHEDQVLRELRAQHHRHPLLERATLGYFDWGLRRTSEHSLHQALVQLAQQVAKRCKTSPRVPVRLTRRSLLYDDPTQHLSQPATLSEEVQSNVILSRKYEAILSGILSIGLVLIAFWRVPANVVHLGRLL